LQLTGKISLELDSNSSLHLEYGCKSDVSEQARKLVTSFQNPRWNLVLFHYPNLTSYALLMSQKRPTARTGRYGTIFALRDFHKIHWSLCFQNNLRKSMSLFKTSSL